MNEKLTIIRDPDGKPLVLINDIKFKGKRRVKWKDVEEYLKTYIGTYYEIAETAEKIYIGSDFPDEYANSEYSSKLRGPLARAKANASQGIAELIEIAINERHQKNYKEKHKNRAKYGWYRYTSQFALPVYNTTAELMRYNVYRVEMLVRHADDGKKYLYDLVNIKKRNEYPA